MSQLQRSSHAAPIWRRLAPALSVLLVLAVAAPADARRKKKGDEEEKIQYTLNEQMAKRLNEALELIQSDEDMNDDASEAQREPVAGREI